MDVVRTDTSKGTEKTPGYACSSNRLTKSRTASAASWATLEAQSSRKRPAG